MHVPVLAAEVLHWLNLKSDGIYVDCTAGAGGHAALIAERIPRGRLVALDRDPTAADLARTRLAEYPGAEVVHANYARLGEVLSERGLDAVDGVLLDAGLSSMQIDTAERGFSFQEEGPLDMRMDTSQGPTAAEYLAMVDEAELARVLKEYGDVGPSRRIASAIVARRRRGQMQTTRDLAEAVGEALSFVRGTPEETRTVFQAVRMAVNDELLSLARGLEQAVAALRPGGRLVVIAFHSGEDRVVKNVLRDGARVRRELHPDGRVRAVHPPLLRILTPKPVTPTADEVRSNPRAHSARLRAAERLGEPVRR
jgi:16S rRNA (cytosine1402-N4)-methyltransferase